MSRRSRALGYIVDEPLLSDDGATRPGTAVLLRAPDPDKACTVLTTDTYADIEVHNWAFDRRPS